MSVENLSRRDFLKGMIAVGMTKLLSFLVLSEDVTQAKTASQIAETREDIPPERGAVGYEFKPGDNLSAIAQTYGVTVEQIMEVNEIVDPKTLRPGHVLLIPGTTRKEAEYGIVFGADVKKMTEDLFGVFYDPNDPCRTENDEPWKKEGRQKLADAVNPEKPSWEAVAAFNFFLKERGYRVTFLPKGIELGNLKRALEGDLEAIEAIRVILG